MPVAENNQPHFRACNICEAMCGVEITVENGRVASIRGDKKDPFSRGYLCPKATALQDVYEDEDRLRYPMRRTPSGFQRIGWDEAFDETANHLKEIQAEHGEDAVAVYLGNPNVHNYGSMLFALPLLKSLGTKNRFSATSVDQLPHHLASYLMFGHQLLLPIPDLDRTDFFLILGANPAISNGSLMSAPDVPHRIRAVRERGGKVIVVDPRRTETAALADRHHFIRPGTDALLLLGMLHTLFAEGRAKPGRLAGFLEGLDILEHKLEEFTPERIAHFTGIDAEEIKALTREFSSARSAVAYGRIGASTQEFGGATQWLINALNIATGNFDRPGGAMFTKPAVDIVALTAKLGQKGHYARGYTRVRKLPEFGGEYPVSTLAEEILTPGSGQIRALVTSAGNPILSTPNGRKLERALASLKFMVSIDFYINETTRHANIILPPTAALEHDNYDIVFHALAVRNTAKYSPRLFEPVKDAKHDYQIMFELATRLSDRGPAGALRGRVPRALFQHLSPDQIVDLLLRLGPYGSKLNPLSRGLSLARLKKEVHGIDLGPLAPCLPDRLYTRARRIQIAPDVLVQDLERVRAKFLANDDIIPDSLYARYDLRLIGRRQMRSNNSWMHNSHRLIKGPNRCTVLLHPVDADRLGISDKQRVKVSSRVGSIELEAEVSEEIMPGVVSIPHGFGHDRPGVELRTAKKHAGASINDLTDEQAIDALTGNAAFSGTPVHIEPLEG